MNKSERLTRSLRARKRRKTIREIKRGLLSRYRRKMRNLKKKYKKIRNRHHTDNL